MPINIKVIYLFEIMEFNENTKPKDIYKKSFCEGRIMVFNAFKGRIFPLQ